MPSERKDRSPDRAYAAVKSWIQNRLRLSEELNAKLWNDKLFNETVIGYVEMDYTVKDLEGAARRRLRSLRLKSKNALEATRKPRLGGPTWEEIDRSEVFAAQLGNIAAREITASVLLENFLGGRYLNAEEARRVLKSPLNAIVGFEFLSQHKIPLAGHTAKITQLTLNRGSGQHHHVELDLEISWPRHTLNTHVRGAVGCLNLHDLLQPLYWVENPHNWQEGNFACACSILDDIHSRAKSIASRFPWTVPQTVWFLLTGVAPGLPVASAGSRPIIRDKYRYMPISITVQPWVTEKTLLRLFNEERRHLGIVGRREIDPKSIALLRFLVSKRWDKQQPNIEEHMRSEWNAANKGRVHYHYTAAAFRSALRRLNRQVMFQTSARKTKWEIHREEEEAKSSGTTVQKSKRKRKKP